MECPTTYPKCEGCGESRLCNLDCPEKSKERRAGNLLINLSSFITLYKNGGRQYSEFVCLCRPDSNRRLDPSTLNQTQLQTQRHPLHDRLEWNFALDFVLKCAEGTPVFLSCLITYFLWKYSLTILATLLSVLGRTPAFILILIDILTKGLSEETMARRLGRLHPINGRRHLPTRRACSPS